MKRYIYNFIILLMGSILGSILVFVTQIMLARNFSVEEFGSYSIAMNFVNIATVFVGFGVGDFLLQVFAAEGYKAYRWVKSSFIILAINIFCIVLIIVIVSISGVYSKEISNLILFFIPFVILQGLLTLTNAVNQIEQNFLLNSLCNLVIYLVRFLSILFPVIFSLKFKFIGITTLVLSVLFGILFTSIIQKFPKKSLILDNKNNINKNQLYKTKPVIETFKKTYPFGLIGIFYYIYYQGDILILSIFRDSKEVAYYSAAFSILSLSFLFPTLLFRKLFLTKIHIWANFEITKLKKFYKFSSVIMLSISIILILFILVFGDLIIELVFGNNYSKASYYLKLLSLAIFFRYTYSISGSILSTKDYISKKARLQGITAIINLSLNLLLVPYFGVNGAVISTVFCEGLLFLLFLHYTKKFFITEEG